MISRSGDSQLTTAQADAKGRRVRYLHQVGDDYINDAALTTSPRGTVLALEACD
jgi:hypothetical protein